MSSHVIHRIRTSGVRLAGPLLQATARGVRQAANRFTSNMIRRQYFSGAPAGRYTLTGMLQTMSPQDFTNGRDAAFLALPGTEKIVDSFLTGSACRRVPLETKQFRDGESYVRITSTIRRKTVVIVAGFNGANPDDDLIQVLLAIDAAKRASAEKVVLVCPTLPYIEQQPGTVAYQVDYFKLVLNLLFRAANLDALQVGNVSLNQGKNLLFLQDMILSQHVAPFVIEQVAYSRPPAPKPYFAITLLPGQTFRHRLGLITDILQRKFSLQAEVIDAIAHSGSLAHKTVCVLQTCNSGSINRDFLEALRLAYCARKKGAQEVLLVMPYLPYNRQERKAQSREPISAKLIFNMLARSAGVRQLITFELHAAATEGFVDAPVHHMPVYPLLAKYFRDLIDGSVRDGWQLTRSKPASPDVGRDAIVRKFGALAIGGEVNLAVIDKQRPRPGEAQVMSVIGRVTGRDLLMYDDMIDTGGTIISAARAFKKRGAHRIYAATTHGVFSQAPVGEEEYGRIKDYLEAREKRAADYLRREGDSYLVNALVRLQANQDIAGIVCTDTIPIDGKNIIDPAKVKVLSVDLMIAATLGRIMSGQSLENIAEL